MLYTIGISQTCTAHLSLSFSGSQGAREASRWLPGSVTCTCVCELQSGLGLRFTALLRSCARVPELWEGTQCAACSIWRPCSLLPAASPHTSQGRHAFVLFRAFKTFSASSGHQDSVGVPLHGSHSHFQPRHWLESFTHMSTPAAPLGLLPQGAALGN